MKKLNIMKSSFPKLAICITMYNENEHEFKATLRGVLQNYNAMYMDPDIKMQQHDFIVVCIVDGYEAIPESFKQFAS